MTAPEFTADEMDRLLRIDFADAAPESWDANAAVRRVLALHESYGIYTECGHDHDEDDEGVVEVDDIGLTCEAGLMYQVCRACCTTGKHFYDFQTEECVTEHDHGPDKPLCPTVGAITTPGKP